MAEGQVAQPDQTHSSQEAGGSRDVHELLREGIVNALVHRDYGIKGAKCQLVASAGKVVVMSPGAPVEPITMKQLAAFDAPMLSRNPVMHFVFGKLKLAEERGLGLKSMRSIASEAGLPLPSYSYKPPYVVLTLYPDAISAVSDAADPRMEQLNEAERAGWAWLITRENATSAEYQTAMEVPERTARNHLKKLTALGLLRVTGSARATRYHPAGL